MLVCIPTNGEAGLDDTVSDHFGSSPFFTLYDSTTGDVQIVRNRDPHHSPGTCHPMRQLEPYHIDGIICRHVGLHAISDLKQKGIGVYRAQSVRVSEIAQQVRDGGLIKMSKSFQCTGQGRDRDGRGMGAGRRGRGTGGQGRGTDGQPGSRCDTVSTGRGRGRRGQSNGSGQ